MSLDRLVDRVQHEAGDAVIGEQELEQCTPTEVCERPRVEEGRAGLLEVPRHALRRGDRRGRREVSWHEEILLHREDARVDRM